VSNKVLLVDDEPSVLAGYRRMLRGQFEIETAIGAEAGLASIRERGPFGVVISDIRMPGMDGVEFLARVRQDAPDAVRLILTGDAHGENAIEAINQGHVFSFLTKPCGKDELAKAITAALAERDKRRQSRVRIKMPVQVRRCSSEDEFRNAHTVDISRSGARLAGLKEPLQRGEVIEIRCGPRKAPFQVVWTGSVDRGSADQAGVECLAAEGNIWELDLTHSLDEKHLLPEIIRARTVQSRLFPQDKPVLQTLDYSGDCIPARMVGGDYYDFLDMGPGEVGLVLADVSGKGVAAALLMANLQGALHSNRQLTVSELPGWLASVNRHFYQHTENHRYATAFFGCYGDAGRKLRYVNCGHNPPLLLRQNGNVERLGPTATVLGLFPEWECSVAETELVSGDVLVIYTDGMTEATNKDKEEFGEQRLQDLAWDNRGRESRAILQNLQHAVREFAGDPEDDLTLVIARAY
jgi:serine phosphatase RsbU (regulator of sigma subunit)/DNA-binding NarL/FixJ family response regulator